MSKIISLDNRNKPGNVNYFNFRISLTFKDLKVWFDLFDNDENINKVKEYNYILY